MFSCGTGIPQNCSRYPDLSGKPAPCIRRLNWIHEFILNNSMDGPLFPALFSLNMLVETDSGQAYSEQQIMDMLAEGGVTDIRRLPVQTPNDSGVITF
jgi:hypothetical protein